MATTSVQEIETMENLSHHAEPVNNEPTTQDKRSGRQLGLLGHRFDGGFGNTQATLPIDLPATSPALSPLDQATLDEQATHQEPGEELFGPVIYSYTRAQAIDDGVLIDVSNTDEHKETGFRFPVALTAAAYAQAVEVPAGGEVAGQSIAGRLWDVLFMLHHAIKTSDQDGPEMLYGLSIWNGQAQEEITLKSICGPGDEGEPVITIMQPHED